MMVFIDGILINRAGIWNLTIHSILCTISADKSLYIVITIYLS